MNASAPRLEGEQPMESRPLAGGLRHIPNPNRPTTDKGSMTSPTIPQEVPTVTVFCRGCFDDFDISVAENDSIPAGESYYCSDACVYARFL